MHVGPSSKLKGGIASVIGTYENNKKLFLSKGMRLTFFETNAFGEAKGYLIFFMLQVPLFLIRVFSVDIIHYHVASNGSFFRKFILFSFGKVFNKTAVLHLHGGGFFDFFESSSLLVRFAVDRFINGCDTVVVVSSEFERKIKHILSADIPVVVVPNSSEEFEAASRLEDCGACKDYILFAGSLAHHKGLEVLIKALGLLKKRGLFVRLLVVGPGDVDKWIKVCERYDVSELVEFKGWVTGLDKIKIYKEAALFCLPSYVESFGISALEAMLSKKPLVCTRLGGFLDLVTHGENGFLVAPGSADELAECIHRLTSDQQLAESMGQAGFNKAISCFTTKSAMGKTISMYKKITKI